MSSTIVKHAVSQKKLDDKDMSKQVKSLLNPVQSKSDEFLEEKLSSYSIDQVKFLVSGVVKDTSRSKGTRRSIVAQVLRNQPHAVSNFEEFITWNQDTRSGKGFVPGLTVGIGVVALGVTGSITETLLGMDNPWTINIIVGLAFSLVFGILLSRKDFTYPKELAYGERWENSISAASDKKLLEAKQKAERKKELEDELAQLA